jgi:hypothetical protein
MRKGQIKRVIREAMGEGRTKPDGTPVWKEGDLDKIVTARTIENLITAARRHMIARVRVSRQIYKTDIVEFLSTVLADPRASYRDKLEANRQLMEIAGVSAADRREERKLGKNTSPSDGGRMTDEQASKLRDAITTMEAEVT